MKNHGVAPTPLFRDYIKIIDMKIRKLGEIEVIDKLALPNGLGF